MANALCHLAETEPRVKEQPADVIYRSISRKGACATDCIRGTEHFSCWCESARWLAYCF